MEHRRTDCCYCGGDGAAVFVSYKRRSTILTTSQTIGALSHALILVAEDEAIIAMDVAMAIRDAGGQVAGPAASVKQALALINTMPVAGAILDVNLSDGDISPVAEILLAAGIPIIIQTGVGLPAGSAVAPLVRPVGPERESAYACPAHPLPVQLRGEGRQFFLRFQAFGGHRRARPGCREQRQ